MKEIVRGSLIRKYPSPNNSFGVPRAIPTAPKLVGTFLTDLFLKLTYQISASEKVDFSATSENQFFGAEGKKIELECRTKGPQTPEIPFRGPGNDIRPIELDLGRFWPNRNFDLEDLQKSTYHQILFFVQIDEKSRKIFFFDQNRSNTEFLLVSGYFWPGWIFLFQK